MTVYTPLKVIYQLRNSMQRQKKEAIRTPDEMAQLLEGGELSVYAVASTKRFNWLSNIADDSQNGQKDTEISLNDLNTLIQLMDNARNFEKKLKKSLITLPEIASVSRQEFDSLVSNPAELKHGEFQLTDAEASLIYQDILGGNRPSDNSPIAKGKRQLLQFLINSNVQIIKSTQLNGAKAQFIEHKSRPTIVLNAHTLEKSVDITSKKKRSKYLAQLNKSFFHEIYHAQVHQHRNQSGWQYSKSEEINAEVFQSVFTQSGKLSTTDLLNHIQQEHYLYLTPENQHNLATQFHLSGGRFDISPTPLLQKPTHLLPTELELNLKG